MESTCPQGGANTPLANSRHEAFAQLVADGKAQKDAYLQIYGGKSSKAARTNSARLLAKDYVRARVQFLKEENARQNALSRAEKRQLLAQIAREGENGDRIRAIQEDNRMTGDSEDKMHISGVFNLNW